jgi:hypothetical protein
MPLSQKTLNILRQTHYVATFEEMDIKTTLSEEDVEIKKSKNPDAGFGLFTKKDISKGDIVLCCPNATNPAESHVTKMINDLAYNYNLDDYENDNLVLYHTNLSYKTYILSSADGALGQIKVFLVAMRDIKKGEELSRYYGNKYWIGQ